MSTGHYEDLAGCPVLDAEGATAGTVRQVYFSDATGQPGWVVVRAGTDDSGDRFAPLAGSELRGGYLVLAVPARLVIGAPWPALDSAGHLPATGAEELSRYYTQPGTGPGSEGPDAGTGMILSEERLRVGTERVVTGRARLVKYVVTEEVTLTVQVSHEEVRVELDPPAAIAENQPGRDTDGEWDSSTRDTGGHSSGWMILHAERPVVQLESVPVERVRLRVQAVTGQQEITGQVHKEQTGAPEIEAIPPAP